MRAASPASEASKPRQTLPLKSIKPVKPIKHDEPSSDSKDDNPSHRRKIQVVKPEPAPHEQSPPAQIQPTPQMRAPTPEEVESDPLVKSVLDVFEGEIKRVHPKNK